MNSQQGRGVPFKLRLGMFLVAWAAAGAAVVAWSPPGGSGQYNWPGVGVAALPYVSLTLLGLLMRRLAWFCATFAVFCALLVYELHGVYEFFTIWRV